MQLQWIHDKLSFQLGKELFTRRVGIVAGILVALYETLIFYDGELLKASLAVVVAASALLLLIRVARSPKFGTAFFAGLLLACLVQIRGNLAVFLLVAIAWVVLETARETPRAAIRTVIRYRAGVLQGKGASLLDGYMEDLATDRIYRLMIAQRLRHSKQVPIVDEDGKPVEHSWPMIRRLFDEELERILGEIPEGSDQSIIDTFREAKTMAEGLIFSGQFDPV